MSELAKLADVDVSTVSRALSDSPLVNEKTRKLVQKVAAETGYMVNASARNLRKQSSETLGLVIPIRPESGQTISDPFFLEIVGAITQAAASEGYDLIVTLPKQREAIAEKRLLQTGKADGLIVIGEAGRQGRLNSLGALAEKAVVWGGQIDQGSYTVIGSDNRRGGYLAGAHLLERQRRKIAFIGSLDLPEVSLRYNGFCDALTEAGLAHDKANVLEIDFGETGAFEAILKFLRRNSDIDGIFAASDVLAMAAIHAISHIGKSVPGDISIVGYDNIFQSRMIKPSLTTIDQHISLGGQKLVETLINKLKGETCPAFTTPTDLVVRESS